MRTSAKPHVYARAHLANSASLLLPVSNLTNLLAFHASGRSLARFAELMALPTIAAVGVEWAVFIASSRPISNAPAKRVRDRHTLSCRGSRSGCWRARSRDSG
jgi:arsenical pump membrane protein